MADMTVYPDTLELVLTQQEITLPGATHIQYAVTFGLALTLSPPLIVVSFPGISRRPSHIFSDEPSDAAVLIGSTASGYPVLNKQFTFDPRTFTPELRSVSEVDKLIVMAFYEQQKDIPFPWYNNQDGITYEVAFVRKPWCHMDGRKDLWRIQLILRQTTP